MTQKWTEVRKLDLLYLCYYWAYGFSSSQNDTARTSVKLLHIRFLRFPFIWPRSEVKDRKLELLWRLHYRTYELEISLGDTRRMSARRHLVRFFDFRSSDPEMRPNFTIWIVISLLSVNVWISKFWEWYWTESPHDSMVSDFLISAQVSQECGQRSNMQFVYTLIQIQNLNLYENQAKMTVIPTQGYYCI